MGTLIPKSDVPALPKRRLPKYAGQIFVRGGPNTGDYALPQVLFSDAVAFVGQGDSRSCRAAVFSAFAALEAFLNQLAFGHIHHDLDQIGSAERDVMEEMRTKLDPDTGEIIRVKENLSLDARFLFSYAYFRQERFEKGGALWQRFRDAKAIRDQWTHPKPPFDVNGPTTDEAHRVVSVVGEMLRSLMTLPHDWMWPFGKSGAD